MVRIILIAVMFQHVLGQDSLQTQGNRLNQSDITLLLSYYDQDGDQSAVTGGTGTEKLKVYSVKYGYRRAVSPHTALHLDLGIDVISSASTDHIDFNMSSASKKDGHETIAVGFSRKGPRAPVEYGVKLNGSLESDYLSRGIDIWMNRRQELTTYGFQFKMFFADLRWGWLNKPYLKPSHLIYPAELRDTAWFDSAHRSSYNLFFLYQRALAPDLSIGIYPAMILQRGLLSTPFHRVYFAGVQRPAVERLPKRRRSASLSIRVNKQFANSGVLRSLYQVYLDNFGMVSHTLQCALPLRLSPRIVISPSARIFHQSASEYFAPFNTHVAGTQFYTSDHDLSRFWSTNVGLQISMRRRPTDRATGVWSTPAFSIRYAYYRRTGGLHAHVLTTLFRWDREDLFIKRVKPTP
ncbi:MAG: DUF3570 domain-containing protein [Saprospiraceae bacterium]|nr:DUF3570 domain-containing protein [Saprospiraceae bacterium]